MGCIERFFTSPFGGVNRGRDAGVDAYSTIMSAEWMNELLDHVDTPADLAYSRHAICRWYAASQADRLEPRALRMLVRDPAPAVRIAVASRTGLDEETIDRLTYDQNTDVLIALASLQPLTDGQKDRMMGTPDATVCELCGDMRAARLLRHVTGSLQPEPRQRKGWLA
ncbi:hypothetical protein PG2022B_0953 [Bifidobacterium animalis subsp. animalis]|nr:hypothetical protein PG2022B_0953 [Bifidobacterium animalis subsp. animalis]